MRERRDDQRDSRRDVAADAVHEEVQTGVVTCIPHLRAFARSLTSNRDLADDLVHDAIARALAAARQYTPGTNFKAWIFTILRNLYYNEGRKRHGRFTSIDDLGVNEPMIAASQEATLEFCDFRRAFWHLNADQREVLMLVGASGLSYEEAAEVCGCAVGTIKSRASRARQDLKELLSGTPLPVDRTAVEPVAGRNPIDLLKHRKARSPAKTKRA
ncbi:MAG: sigma-70 family RNA polymerase sigma factor [Dongiaceae bacterium]